MECRYCLMDIDLEEKDIFPCECKSPVHKKCLDEWNSRRISNYNRCEICNTEYKFKYYKFCKCSFQKIYILMIGVFYIIVLIFTVFLLLELRESKFKIEKFEKLKYLNSTYLTKNVI